MATEHVLPEYKAPDWASSRSESVVLWHGTTSLAREGIERRIDLTKCAVDSDFGRGFYLTTLERQARFWAWGQYARWSKQNPPEGGVRPIILRFRVRRFAAGARPSRPAFRGLDRLTALTFVRGGFESDDYWSLVQHCRSSEPADLRIGRRAVVRDHRRGAKGRGWYDVVSGPVAAFWDQRVVMQDSDQFSFHTPAAVAVLQDLIALARETDTRNRDDAPYNWFAVTETP